MSKEMSEVCIINDVKPHPNADKLELAIIKGYQVVVGKGEFKSGDMVIFILPDSVLPLELSDKLNITQHLKDGRVRVVRLRGEYSYGLVIPVIEYPRFDRKEGDCVDQFFGIAKYEPPTEDKSCRKGKQISKKNAKFSWYRLKHFWNTNKPWWFKIYRIFIDPVNPFGYLTNESFNKYTDIENLKKFPNMFQDNLVAIHEKIEGTNFRAGWIKGDFYVGSHNVNLTEDKDNLYWRMAYKYNLKEILQEEHERTKDDIIIYGEIYGKENGKTIPNGNKTMHYGQEEPKVVFFDIKRGNVFMNYEILREYLKRNNLPMTPLIYYGKWYDDVIEKAEYNTMICPKDKVLGCHMMEGLIIRSWQEETHPVIGRKILKYKSNRYLMDKNS